MSYLKKIDLVNGDASAFPGGLGEGANIRTPCGPRRVEMVRPGDLIVTRDNGLQPVRLIWMREIVTTKSDLAPICLCQRAIGPMMPQHKMYVAPDHRVLVPGYRLLGQNDTSCCLVYAREIAASSDDAFVDGTSYVKRFYTFVFDEHQLFCCNGLPVESFLAGATEIAGLKADHREELVQLFPHLQQDPNSYRPAGYKPVERAEFLVDSTA